MVLGLSNGGFDAYLGTNNKASRKTPCCSFACIHGHDLNAGTPSLCPLPGKGLAKTMQWQQLWAVALVGREYDHVSSERPQAWSHEQVH